MNRPKKELEKGKAEILSLSKSHCSHNQQRQSRKMHFSTPSMIWRWTLLKIHHQCVVVLSIFSTINTTPLHRKETQRMKTEPSSASGGLSKKKKKEKENQKKLSYSNEPFKLVTTFGPLILPREPLLSALQIQNPAKQKSLATSQPAAEPETHTAYWPKKTSIFKGQNWALYSCSNDFYNPASEALAKKICCLSTRVNVTYHYT